MKPGKLLQLLVLIIENEELTDTDKLVSVITALWQVSYGHVSQRKLSKELGVDYATVQRTLRKLKDLEFVSIEKESRYIWIYNFDGFFSDRASMKLGGNSAHSSAHALHVLETYFSPEFFDRLVHAREHAAYVVNLILSFLFKLLTGNACSSRPVFPEKTGCFSKNACSENREKPSRRQNPKENQEGTDVPIVCGPTKGKLYQEIDGVLTRPSRKKKREGAAVQKKKRKPKTEDKSLAEYNCNDLEKVFRQTWSETWGTRTYSFWTIKERKHAKRLIDEHGGEAVVNYIKYVIGQWDDLCRRYRVNGYPSMGAIYGYRRSWFPESVNGKLAVTSRGEYSGSDIPSGRWE